MESAAIDLLDRCGWIDQARHRAASRDKVRTETFEAERVTIAAMRSPGTNVPCCLVRPRGGLVSVGSATVMAVSRV
jgi:hypothetical protein